MSKKSVAPYLMLLLTLSACNSPQPIIVRNEIPQGLLICQREPDTPIIMNQNYQKDFKNLAIYIAELKTFGRDCEDKLSQVGDLLNETGLESR